ncbi:MAG: DNA adenine methylase [Bacteroidetes bacterium]|uniref:Methyltransferase n=1 Tax=Candidatus Limisoma faecipullorum TaxID=2840854 RepID=A0A9D9ISN7_9BACT|nr:DNA adenine methylase [Candidatus Limisoma faecipullorum]
MKFDKEHWKDIDINIDSLWLIGPRAKGGKRTNFYHGNFVPQIPDHLIRRYTDENDTVLDIFMGSGTTLFECERLNRNFIGFDINQDIIDFVENKMKDSNDIKYCINNCDVTDAVEFEKNIVADLKLMGKRTVDFLIAHPPYMDIVKFTDRLEDLSNTSDLNEFIRRFTLAMENGVKYLKSGKHFAVIVGDLYRNSEVLPLGFYLMDSIKRNIKCKLKGIVIKDMVGNRAKIGLESLWRYKCLKSDYFLFKHEYIFVFKKGV